MSDDIKAGDVVVCVEDPQGSYDVAWEPVVGGYYRVAGLVGLNEGSGSGIELAEDPDAFDPNGAWDAVHFRKIDAPKSEVADRIRACRPVKTEQPA